MKKFVFRFILTFLFLATLVLLVEYLSIQLNKKYGQGINGVEVYHSISKSKESKKVKKLLLGDSVGNQLYSNNSYNDSIYSLTCNQAISLAGHYFLLNNFFKSNENQLPEEVILLYIPFAFRNNLDIYAYHYFLKPFYNDEYKDLMDEYLTNRIKQIPYYYLTQIPIVKESNYSPKYSLTVDSDPSELFSPISQTYLLNIINLCNKHNVHFRLESGPIREDRRIELDELIASTTFHYKDVINNYLSNIVYYDDSLYIDRVHFDSKYIPNDFLELK